MKYFFFHLLIIVILLFLFRKATIKIDYMNSNFLLQSEVVSNLVDRQESKEKQQQLANLIQDRTYRVVEIFFNEEICKFLLLSIIEQKDFFKDSKKVVISTIFEAIPIKVTYSYHQLKEKKLVI